MKNFKYIYVIIFVLFSTIGYADTNVATSGTATQSTTCYGGIASRAIDGNTNSSWSQYSIQHTCKDTEYEWWQVDLGSEKNITQLKLYPRYSDGHRFETAYVMVSDTPFNPDSTQSSLNTSYNNADWKDQIPNNPPIPTVMDVNTSGRYVLIQWNGNNKEYLNIAEVEVYALTNIPPIADAGPDQNMTQEKNATMDGSQSTDDSNITDYKWEVNGHTYHGVDAIIPSADLQIGDNNVTLTVTDDAGKTDTDNMNIHVLELIIYFDKDHYNISEDITDLGTKETVYPLIKLNYPSSRDITVHYHTQDGSARVIDGDYVEITDKMVTIPAGDTNISIPIKIYNDAPIELDENFTVILFDPIGAFLDDRNTTQINILAQEDSPVCFEDDFEDYLTDDLANLESHHWRVLENPNAGVSYTPHVVDVNGDHRLRITGTHHNLATVVTKDYEFTTSQNLIIVEFDYYAWGGCSEGGNGGGIYGADGIVNVLYDSSVGESPVPGARGGSMGYAQMTATNPDQDGFQGGWIGMGIDEFGNFSNPTEGRKGTSGNAGFRRNAVAIRGDGNGINGYEYLQGTPAGINPPVAQEKSKQNTDYYSGQYKMTIDARDPAHLYITLTRDMDPNDATAAEILISKFDAKATGLNQGATPDLIRYAITGGSGGGCNNHELGWIKLRGNCASYQPTSYKTGPFDAWDKTIRDVRHRKISTKIAAQNFDLTLASLNEDNTGVESKNGIDRVYYGLVKYKVADQSYTYLTNPIYNTPLDFSNTNHPTYDRTFNTTHASSITKAVFRFCSDYNGTVYTLYPPDTNCSHISPNTVLGEDTLNQIGWRETLSSDHFAIRPSQFTIDTISSPQIAGVDFNVTVHAQDAQGNDTLDYNETVNVWGASPSLDHNDTDPNCQPATRNLTASGGFKDGKATLTLNYNEVSALKIRLGEHNATDYAHIDLNDTNYNNTIHDSPDHKGSIYREITSALENNVTFIPDHFTINKVELHDHHEIADHNFTYMASVPPTYSIDKGMTAKLDLNISAKTATDQITHNYNSQCYAKPIDLDIAYLINNHIAKTPNDTGTLSKILYRVPLVTEMTGGQSLNTSPLVINNVREEIFSTTADHNGTALMQVQLNFDRNYQDTVNPFKLHIKDVNVTDNTDTANIITDSNTSASAEHNATFLYARARPSKYFYTSTTTPKTTPMMVQVYCDNWPATTTNCPGIDIASQTNEYKWFLSIYHDKATNNDGNITLKTNTPTGTINPTAVSINTADAGTTNAIQVGGTAPVIVDIDFDTTNLTDTNEWLIYNKDAKAIPAPFYKVKFIGVQGWTGEGKTGNVVGDNINSKKTQRLGW